MILRLVGHNYKYAVEQIQMALFPETRPVYSTDPIISSDVLNAVSRLSFGLTYAQATTSIRCGDRVSHGTARVARSRLAGKLITDRLLQRVIKQSFYRAAVKYTGTHPVWGSLTGIRPAKLVSAALEAGANSKTAADMLMREYYVAPERAVMCLDAAKAALDMKRKLEPRDIALYVGIPFCPTRCAYCSFVSNSVEKSFALIDPFVQALLRETGAVSMAVRELGLRVRSVYIGGGTPTALPDEALDSVMAALSSSFDLSNVLEYTVEAGRPETLSQQKIDIIGAGGAGRICINPQSMSDQVLSAIGRRHTAEDVLSAVGMVRRSKMTLNMDVIAGLPCDDPGGFSETLDSVMELEPENITVHTLSLKKGSRILLEGTPIPGATEVEKMLAYASQRLKTGGYSPYYLYRQKFTSGGFENTGWRLPGFDGIYNICMMEELCTVLSLGGGGVTKIVSPGGRIERIFNAKYPREYIMQSGTLEAKIGKIKTLICDDRKPRR